MERASFDLSTVCCIAHLRELLFDPVFIAEEQTDIATRRQSLDFSVLIVFLVVYLGMILGGIPPLAVDRTGIALLGSIALLALGRVDTNTATRAVDIPTMALLFGLMIVSAQFRLAGFYTWLVRRVGAARVGPASLLALVILTVGLLSALLANDIVCLAVAPILVECCRARGLAPMPFLLALACAANVGSAATLIGNPQNMLIGQVLHLSFKDYLLHASVPAVLGLAVVWGVLYCFYRGKWESPHEKQPVAAPEFSHWQTIKGLFVLVVLVVFFLIAPWPREAAALAAGGLLLCSRRMRSREMLALVDWQLLVLFFGLFIVNYALQQSGWLEVLMSGLAASGINPSHPGWLFALSTALSNLVSNVPAVMLLLPSATHPQAGAVLALSSTLAGNLLLVGSIANLIVADQAARYGIRITWGAHARVGVPVTLLTLLIAGLWLWLLT